MKKYTELNHQKSINSFGMEKTYSGYWKYYSLLHGRTMYFDDMESCSMHIRYTEKIEKMFENPTLENREERINFCNNENLFINID